MVLDRGSVPLAPGSLVVHCAASGLQYPPLVPIWGADAIRLQTIRAGFPCFDAALAGYVEATRDDDRERNRLCPPNTLPDNPANWARMQVRGTLGDAGVRRGAGHRRMGRRLRAQSRAHHAVATRGAGGACRAARLADVAAPGLTRLAALAGEPLPGARDA